MFNISRRLREFEAEKFFMICALSFGLWFIAFNPPLQVPDEHNHFYRAWQISEGTFTSEIENNRVGGTLPNALRSFTDFFSPLMLSGPELNYNKMPVRDLRKNTVNEGERSFYDFNNTALYSSICYFPAALGIFLLKQFHLPVLFIFYGARLFNFIFWVFAVFFALKFLPIFKWLFCFLALLPMSLYINSSLSADVVTNGICFLFIGIVLHYAFEVEKLTMKEFIILFLMVFLLISVKTFYSPLALLILFIPRQRIGRKMRYIVVLLLFGLFSILLAAYYNHSIDRVYRSYENYNVEFRDAGAFFSGADKDRQIDFMKTQKWFGADIIAKATVQTFPSYFHQYVGIFGWLNLPLSKWITGALLLMIFLTAAMDNSSEIQLSVFQKIFALALFYFILCLVFLSQYLIFNPAGSPAVGGIQGRYMAPFFGLLLFSLYGAIPSHLMLTKAIVIGSSLFGIGYSLYFLFTRYFG